MHRASFALLKAKMHTASVSFASCSASLPLDRARHEPPPPFYEEVYARSLRLVINIAAAFQFALKTPDTPAVSGCRTRRTLGGDESQEQSVIQASE